MSFLAVDRISGNKVSDQEYIEALKKHIDWVEGERDRLEKDVEEMRNIIESYENRNNSLEG